MARQLKQLRMIAIRGGAITAPTAVPALMIPMAVARCEGLNHSATARVAAGKLPPSPAPKRNRLTANIANVVAKAWLAQASDQKIIITVNPRRVPSTSTNFPPPAYMKAYANRKVDCRAENCWLESGISFAIALTATGSV